MKKKVFALMLTLCMVLTMMPSMAWADGNGDDDGPKYIDVLAVMYDDGPKALGDAQPYITKFGVDTGIMLMTGVKQEESGLMRLQLHTKRLRAVASLENSMGLQLRCIKMV